MLEEALATCRPAHHEGRHAQVTQLLGPALAAAHGARGSAPWCEAHTLLAHAWFGLGDAQLSVEHARVAAAGCLALGDAAGATRARRLAAFALDEQGDTAAALDEARAAFDLAEAHQLHFEALQLLALIGTLHRKLGDFDGAEMLLMQGLSRAQERLEQPITAHLTTCLVNVLVDAHAAQSAAGDLERAAATAQRVALHNLRLVGLCRGEQVALRRALQLSAIGAAFAVCGRLDDAAAALQDSIAISRAESFGAAEMKAWLRLARVRLLQQRADDARAAADEMARLLQRHDRAEAHRELELLRAAIADATPVATAAARVPAAQLRHEGADLLRRLDDLEAGRRAPRRP